MLDIFVIFKLLLAVNNVKFNTTQYVDNRQE